SLAHLIRPGELPQYPPTGGYLQFLRGYVAAIDDAARPRLRVEWRGSDALRIDGPVTDGMLVALMVSYDAGWNARQDGRSIAIEPDKLGMMTLRTSVSAASSIELVRRATFEQQAMAAVCALVWTLALGKLWKEFRGARAEAAVAV
ncbi:MAG: hypothetical protein ACRD8O_12710, partial [Bryobacteraceae bacterium]